MSQTTWYAAPSAKDSSNVRYRKPDHLNFEDDSPAIPVNPNSKRYSMEEVFQVWLENRDQILSTADATVTPGSESYKNPAPAPIYHLEIHAEKRSSNVLVEGVTESLAQLSTATRPPPGFNGDVNGAPPLVDPAQIEWIYLDPQGNEQGPFNGLMMHEWFTGGYLTADLRIRRKDEVTFRTLREFCEAVQNFVLPFTVPLPKIKVDYPPQIGQMLNGSFSAPFLNPNLFGNDPFQGNFLAQPLFQTQPYQQLSQSYPNQFGLDSTALNLPLGGLSLLNQQPTVPRTNSGWGLDTSSSLISNPGTPAPSATTPLVSQPAPVSPWIASAQSSSRVSSPFVPGGEKPGDQVFDELHSSVVSDILNDTKARAQEAERKQAEDAQREREAAAAKQAELARIAEQRAEAERVEAERRERQEREEALRAQAILQQASQAEAAAKAQVEAETPTKPAFAPWASATESKPQMTLKEIQRLEAERFAKEQEALKAEQKTAALAAARAWASEDKEEKPALPKTSSWATTNVSTPVVTKTLAEIQKEEAELAAQAQALSKATANTMSAAVAAAKPAVATDNAWTTVTSKKPPVKKTTTTPIITNSTIKASPQVLRSVSAARPVVSSINSSAIREDFLVWARGAMTNLYPTVAKDELLEIFTTIPANGDSSQLIAETIYSSSATMDGRRFAQEFLRRRQRVEQQVGPADSVTWASAITASADKVTTVDEDGWTTSKKKGRKH